MNQSPSGRLLVMEPDYLPIPKIFVSAVTYTPRGLHTNEDCTPFRDRGVRGMAPSAGGFGGNTPEAKNWVVFGPWFSTHFIVVLVLELVVLGV